MYICTCFGALEIFLVQTRRVRGDKYYFNVNVRAPDGISARDAYAGASLSCPLYNRRTAPSFITFNIIIIIIMDLSVNVLGNVRTLRLRLLWPIELIIISIIAYTRVYDLWRSCNIISDVRFSLVRIYYIRHVLSFFLSISFFFCVLNVRARSDNTIYYYYYYLDRRLFVFIFSEENSLGIVKTITWHVNYTIRAHGRTIQRKIPILFYFYSYCRWR